MPLRTSTGMDKRWWIKMNMGVYRITKGCEVERNEWMDGWTVGRMSSDHEGEEQWVLSDEQ